MKTPAVVLHAVEPGRWADTLAVRPGLVLAGAALVAAATVAGAWLARHRGGHREIWYAAAAGALAGLPAPFLSSPMSVPRLYGIVDRPPWIALVLQDIVGRQPRLPWRTTELRRVVAALDRLAGALIPAPVPVADRAPLARRGPNTSGSAARCGAPGR